MDFWSKQEQMFRLLGPWTKTFGLPILFSKCSLISMDMDAPFV
jgi:hypothetical protein